MPSHPSQQRPFDAVVDAHHATPHCSVHNASPSRRRRIPFQWAGSEPHGGSGGEAPQQPTPADRGASEQSWAEMLRRTSPSNSPDKPQDAAAAAAAAAGSLPQTQPRRREFARPGPLPQCSGLDDIVSPSPRPVPPPTRDFPSFSKEHAPQPAGFLDVVSFAPPGGYYVADGPAHQPLPWHAFYSAGPYQYQHQHTPQPQPQPQSGFCDCADVRSFSSIRGSSASGHVSPRVPDWAPGDAYHPRLGGTAGAVDDAHTAAFRGNMDTRSIVSSASPTPLRQPSPPPGPSAAQNPVYGPSPGLRLSHAQAALVAAAAESSSTGHHHRPCAYRRDPYGVSPTTDPSPSPTEQLPSYIAQAYDAIMRAESGQRFTPYAVHHGPQGHGFHAHHPPGQGYWGWYAGERAAATGACSFVQSGAPRASVADAANNTSAVLSDADSSSQPKTPRQLRGHAPPNPRPRTPPTPKLPLGGGAAALVAAELVASSRRSSDSDASTAAEDRAASTAAAPHEQRNRRLRGRHGYGDAWGPDKPVEVYGPAPPAPVGQASPRQHADDDDDDKGTTDEGATDGPPTPTRNTSQPLAAAASSSPPREAEPFQPPEHAYTRRAALSRRADTSSTRSVFIDPSFTGDRAAFAATPGTLRLGGIQGNVCPSSLATVIESVVGVRPLGVAIFRPMMGIAVLWLRDPESESERVAAQLHQRAWMSGHALYIPTGEDERVALEGHATAIPKGSRVPRRLMTCEPWEERNGSGDKKARKNHPAAVTYIKEKNNHSSSNDSTSPATKTKAGQGWCHS